MSRNQTQPSMLRLTSLLTVLLSAALMSNSAKAWQPVTNILESTPNSAQTPNEIRILKLTPAAEPIPAMRYRFWPDRMALKPGNAMIRFQRAGILRHENDYQNARNLKQFWDNWSRWIEMPLAELPVDEVRNELEAFQPVLRELHAGRLLRDSNYDFPVEQIKGLETVELLLPEFQGMRTLARILQLDIRLAIVEGRTDDAIRSLQTGFRLGESTGQAIDYLVVRLIGLAISGIMLGEVENLMQAEDCPNLYWALASLPPSVSEVLESIQFESNITSRVFSSLENLPEEGQPAEVWEQHALEILADLQRIQSYGYDNQEDIETNSRLLAALAIVALADHSKNTLVTDGWDKKIVNKMSPAEVVVRGTAWSLQKIQDDFAKWSYLPDEKRGEYFGIAEKTIEKVRQENQSLGDLGAVMAGLLFPAMQAAHTAGLRTEQSIARLATIEAIRHHVSQTGEVPENLDQLAELPAWSDPIISKPFIYEKLNPQSAKLIAAPRWNGDTDNSVVLSFE